MKKIFLISIFCLMVFAKVQAQDLNEQIDAVDKAQQESEAADRAVQHAKDLRIAKQQQEIKDSKAHDQAYKDRMRDMDLEERSIQIQAKKTLVNRENDYIDEDLKAQAAQTDVIKSNADVNRNVSQGMKTYLEKSGDAGQGQAKKQPNP